MKPKLSASTTNVSEPKGVVQELVMQRQGLPYKRSVLRGPDGRIIKHVERSWEEIVSDFWSQVKRGNPNDCWEWQGALSSTTDKWHNYGVTTVNWKITRTHRFAYMLEHGPIPKGIVIRHTCDNPPCCNPRHLIAGTQKENIEDCWRRGRHKSKLTKEDVINIRKRYVKRSKSSDENSAEQLAKEFGVSSVTIWHTIRNGWQHV